jgi:PAS domain S-box-containing protein
VPDEIETATIERLQAELAALRESEEQYRLLIETTDTGFVILDEAGRVLDANAVYVRLTGHQRREEILGRPVTEWTAPEDAERNAAEVRRCVVAGAVRNLEIDYCGPDGRRIPVELNATVRRLRGGLTILTVCRQISDRRRTEEELRNTEQRYRTTIDSMAEFIHVVDPELRILLLNRTGREWLAGLGVTDEMVGRNVFEAFPFLDERVREEYRRAFAGEGTLITRERNTVGGREVETETRKIPIVEGRRVARVVTVIRDVTDEVRAQEQLCQADKLNALGQLAGGIAHDFNNQLTAILGYAELLDHGAADAQTREYADAIKLIASRSADLTRQLLAFARKGRPGSAVVEVHALLGEVARMLDRTIDPRIAIRTRLDAPAAETVGDPGQLQSAFLNLALNARDAMPDGGELTFRTDVVALDEAQALELLEAPAAGRYLRVQVADTGLGMSEAVRRRLFEPFFTTKEPGRGTGMGLAAVYGTIRNHRGGIRVESEPGRGSVFTVFLPLAAAGAATGRPAVEGTPVAGRGHVLLAEDRPAVLQVTTRLLTRLGYRVTACTNGLAALEQYRQAWREIDLVFLDVMMPGLSGSAALAEMRRNNPKVRAVLCSGHPIGPDEERLLADPTIRFLQKPFTMTDLARCLAAATPEAAADDAGDGA